LKAQIRWQLTKSYECSGSEVHRRIRALVRRYQDPPLGFCDAAVLACAEGSNGRVLTFDRRDFDVVAREATISVQPLV
jgi:predicted nucleic acid-binding protein